MGAIKQLAYFLAIITLTIISTTASTIDLNFCKATNCTSPSQNCVDITKSLEGKKCPCPNSIITHQTSNICKCLNGSCVHQKISHRPRRSPYDSRLFQSQFDKTYIELVLVSDYHTWTFFNNKTEEVIKYHRQVITAVNLLFQKLNSEVVMVFSHIFYKEEILVYGTTEDAATKGSLALSKIRGELQVPVDMGIFLIGKDFPGDKLAFAYDDTQKSCTPYKGGAVQVAPGGKLVDVDVMARRVAQTLAKLVKVDFDGSSCTPGCIMAEGRFGPKNEWSDCSQRQWKANIAFYGCIRTKAREDCSKFGDCNGNGRCVNGACVCYGNWEPPSCTAPTPKTTIATTPSSTVATTTAESTTATTVPTDPTGGTDTLPTSPSVKTTQNATEDSTTSSTPSDKPKSYLIWIIIGVLLLLALIIGVVVYFVMTRRQNLATVTKSSVAKEKANKVKPAEIAFKANPGATAAPPLTMKNSKLARSKL